jgi:hypothetical protein
MPHGVFLDTNVYVLWAEGRFLAFRRELARRRTPVFVAPVVITEAIEDYWVHPNDVLSINRRVLKLIFQHSSRILPPRRNLGAASARAATERALQSESEAQSVAQMAALLHQIGTHFRDRGHDGRHGFDKATFKQNVDAYRDSYEGDAQ